MNTLRAWSLALVVFASGAVYRVYPGEPPSGKIAASGLDALKKLAGDWVALDKDGKPTEKVMSSIRVTAGGSTVVETLFPGTPLEMLTVYHQDGNDLVLTHYCVLGNQPRMRAVRGGTPDKLVFKFDGGANIRADKDMHMHEATLTLVDADHFRGEWVKCDAGKACETHRFDLVRRKK